MVQILWEWKFPEHGRVNPEDWVTETILAIDEWKFWEKVMLLPLEEVQQEVVLWAMSEFESRVQMIIWDIIEDSIQRYLSYKTEVEDLSDTWVNYKTRNLIDETKQAMRDMQLKAYSVQDTLSYLEDEDMIEFDDGYVFQAIEDILSPYKEVIFSVLIANEDKIKQRLASPKRFRRRQNAKKRKRS